MHINVLFPRSQSSAFVYCTYGFTQVDSPNPILPPPRNNMGVPKVQETFDRPSRYGMDITRSSDLYTAIAASAREGSSPPLPPRRRRDGIFPQREASPPNPTRRRYRSSIYSQSEQQQGPSAISLPTASSLYSQPTDDAQSIFVTSEEDRAARERVNERFIRATQEALFGNYSFPAAMRKGATKKKGVLRRMKSKTLVLFALLKDRLIVLGRKCLFWPERPPPQHIGGRRVIRVNEEGVSPWVTDVTHPSGTYEVSVREVGEAGADDENPPR
ncbi:hypothetical protein BKA80DRAFT_330880 [Phyllosticta citrichinensis]